MLRLLPSRDLHGDVLSSLQCGGSFQERVPGKIESKLAETRRHLHQEEGRTAQDY